MMGVVNKVWIFFSAHPKRQRKLEEAIETTQPESKIQKLKDLCRTRWVQRIDALDRFQLLYPSIVQCMESISAEGSSLWTLESITDSKTLLLAITTTEFLSAQVITNGCLQYLLSLTCSLQAEAKDIMEAVTEVKHIFTALKKVRENITVHHREWFTAIEQMCDTAGVTPTLPRLCARQRNRSYFPAQNPCDYYRQVISVPLLDHLISELESRFSSHKQTALQRLYLVPAVLVTKSFEEIVPKVRKLGEMYLSDLPFISSLQSELHSRYLKWKQQEQEHGHDSLPKTPSLTLPHASALFPNIKVLLLILCTLPVTSCSAERSFSGLKRIKTTLRSTMGNERLSGLALLHLHRDIDIRVEGIVDEFARRHPRRLKLLDILS